MHVAHSGDTRYRNRELQTSWPRQDVEYTDCNECCNECCAQSLGIGIVTAVFWAIFSAMTCCFCCCCCVPGTQVKIDPSRITINGRPLSRKRY